MLGLTGEVGELANLIKKADRGSIDLNEAVWRHKAIMELTDVYIYVLNLAALLGVDLDKSYEQKRAENERRFGNAEA
jgi:NTP pyrophosphatase (non-canonical NTP hydrolase)